MRPGARDLMITALILLGACGGILLLDGTASTLFTLGFLGCVIIGSEIVARRRPRPSRPEPEGLDWPAGAVFFAVVFGASILFDGKGDAWVIGTAVAATLAVLGVRWLRGRPLRRTTT